MHLHLPRKDTKYRLLLIRNTLPYTIRKIALILFTIAAPARTDSQESEDTDSQPAMAPSQTIRSWSPG